jgi:hypothetical protein
VKLTTDDLRDLILGAAYSAVSRMGLVRNYQAKVPESLKDAIGDGEGSPELLLNININDEEVSVFQTDDGDIYMFCTWDDDFSCRLDEHGS